MLKAFLETRGIPAYLLAIFFNAIVDLGDKILLQNAIFKIYDGPRQIVLTALVNALILLPYVMLFTPAGYLSDRFAKNRVLYLSSKAAFFIVAAILVIFYLGYFELALFFTFLLAAQSAIFSPAKYGLIRELFGKEHLTEGNGIVQAITILAILLASLLFSLLFERMVTGTESTTGEIMRNIWPIVLILVLLSILQIYLTKRIPPTVKGDERLKLDWKKYLRMGYLKENLSLAFSNRVIAESILGLALFFGISQVLLAIFGVHLEETTGETNTAIAQAIMALAGVGIAIGAILTARLSRNYIETGLLPIGSLGIALTILAISRSHTTWLLGVEFLLFGIFGGFLIVILYALIQYRAKEHELGRIMAATNFVQNLTMLLFLGITIYAALHQIGTRPLFLTLLIVALIASLYTLLTLPQFLLRLIFKIVASFRYRLSIHRVENFPKDGGALLLGNHVSWIDWMVLSIASPRRVSFVMEREIYNRWYLKPFMRFYGVIPISAKASKDAFRQMGEKLKEGKIVAFFPEGAITRNGHLGKFHKGFEIVAKEAKVPIVPFYIRGLWGSRFSYAEHRLKTNVSKRTRDVAVSFGTPMPCTTTAQELKQRVFELQIESWSKYADTLPPLQHAWLRMAKRQGNALAVADATGTKMGSQKLAAVVLAFSREIEAVSASQRYVGIVMPPSVGGTIVNLAVLARSKTVVNLNYTASYEALAYAIELAEIETIFTSRRFLSRLKEKGIDIQPVLNNSRTIYLEDLKSQIKKSRILLWWVAIKVLPWPLLKRLALRSAKIDDTAAILFSSGSEGIPKGIELSHKNFMANIKQFANLMNFRDDDVIMSTLPTFHSFGLTVSTLAPLIEGIPFVCQPDPTDAESVGKLTALYRGTMLFGTSTFFRIYTKSRKLHPLMFESLRFIAAGAEKLSEEVRRQFVQKFNKEIREGYGTTETSPAVSCNIPDVLVPRYWHLQIGTKIGSVGMPLPGTMCKIVDPESYEELPIGEAGMIIIGGAQVMKGYLKNPKKSAEAILHKWGTRWYITGDKGRLDEDGFLYIVDRYSRFAKIGGEMISLTAVEEQIAKYIPEEVEIIATNIPDSKKGERIVLLYRGEIEEQVLIETIKKAPIHPLMLPGSYYRVEEMPRLGSGKTDIKKARKVAIERAAS